jgi:hypothetical protein
MVTYRVFTHRLKCRQLTQTNGHIYNKIVTTIGKVNARQE